MNQRVYNRDESVVFRKTKEAYGGLSNMAAGFPISVNNKNIWTAEAVYQACRFPSRPDIQEMIVAERSPMTAKMRSRRFLDLSRRDWLEVRTKIMRWCLRVKLAQNWDSFRELLLSTGDLPIVEESMKDPFWGAKPDGERLLIGSNVLGRLLMELRELLKGNSAQELIQVSPPNVSDFLLFGERVGSVGRLISGGSITEQVRTGTEHADRTHIFVSYATEDAQFVDWLCLKLIATGYRVWCDRLKLFGGESYPRDIDLAITGRTFRFLSVLSAHSINKPNPLKERTLALNLARERRDNFVIPLNIDGLKPTELGWMQSDLTFISFLHSWGDGLRQLLQALEVAHTPKFLDGRSGVEALLACDTSVVRAQETLWSNLLEIERVPAILRRYEHSNAMTASHGLELLRRWPHYRENATVCWAFEPPPPEMGNRFEFSSRGVCEDWRKAQGPDLNFYNLGKKVLNAAVRHKLLSVGLQEDRENGALFVPEGLVPERMIYRTPNGKSWLRATGLRRFKGATLDEKVRYHLAPECRVLLDYFGSDVVQLRIRLNFTNSAGYSLDPKLVLRRRKAICKTWWNHQWLARIFATLELLSQGQDSIQIGTTTEGLITLSRWPRKLVTDMRLDEDQLRPATLAAEEFADAAVPHVDEEQLVVDHAPRQER